MGPCSRLPAHPSWVRCLAEQCPERTLGRRRLGETQTLPGGEEDGEVREDSSFCGTRKERHRLQLGKAAGTESRRLKVRQGLRAEGHWTLVASAG